MKSRPHHRQGEKVRQFALKTFVWVLLLAFVFTSVGVALVAGFVH